jgi:hypothetical protein
MTKSLAGILLVAAAGCPSVKATETTVPPFDGPTVEFDPINKVLPFPNNLALDPTTGRVNLGMQCHEGPTQTALRTQVLNQLDGFGTFEAAMTFTTNAANTSDAAVDMTTLATNIVMYQRTRGSTMVDPTTAVPIPVSLVSAAPTMRFTSDCASTQTANQVTLAPLVPLEEKSTYVVAVLGGLTTTGGTPFLPSPTWALVRQATEPVTVDPMTGNVTAEHLPSALDLSSCAQPVPSCAQAATVATTCPQLAQLCGIDQLWKAHNPGLTFLDKTGKITDRSQVDVAWEFTTQTTTDPLDPTVAGSPANTLSNVALLGTFSVATAKGAPCSNGAMGCTAFLTASLPPNSCTSLPCNAVGDVIGAGLGTIPYQPPTTNMFNMNKQPIPGQWTDPVHPMSQSGVLLEVIAVIPNPNVVGPQPANGWPTVVFGHGLGSKKETVLAIAPQLAKAGFATIAIDFQAHGSRAVPISNDPALGCAGTCSVTTSTTCDVNGGCPMGESCINAAAQTIAPDVTHQCYSPFLATNLGLTRDNIRQTVLDLQRLVRAAKACGATNCVANGNAPNGANGNSGNVLAIDPNHIVYTGISLGGIVGATTFSVDPTMQSAVLNVAAVGWADIFENSDTLEIVCPVIDGLIDAGVLMGMKWNGMDGANASGLCTTPAWKTQPGYAQFAAIARWILDPADGANFTAKLAPKRFLLMEVVNDQVVPNVATDIMGELVSLTPKMADPETGAAGASMAITMNAGGTKWVRYANLPASAPSFPGNTFVHSSLLQPANANLDGVLGTVRVQTDAITYLILNH